MSQVRLPRAKATLAELEELLALDLSETDLDYLLDKVWQVETSLGPEAGLRDGLDAMRKALREAIDESIRT